MSNKDQVKQYWGESAPEWVWKLAEMCDQSSQRIMAGRIGKSPALVNLVLKKQYTGRMDRVEHDVRRIIENKPLMCPIQGMIEPETCMRNQKLPYDGSNHMRVALFKACRKCPNNARNKDKTNA